MNLYYWEFRTEDIRWFTFAILGAVASFLTAGLIQSRYEKQNIMITCLIVVTLLAMIKVLFRKTATRCYSGCLSVTLRWRLISAPSC